jgi:hypothetical protein
VSLLDRGPSGAAGVEQEGILDRPEFAAGLAIFCGGLVLLLLTRRPRARRQLNGRN